MPLSDRAGLIAYCSTGMSSIATILQRPASLIHRLFPLPKDTDHCPLPAPAFLCRLVGRISAQPVPDVKDADAPKCWATRANSSVTIASATAGLPVEYVRCMRANRLAYARRHHLEYCEFRRRLSSRDSFSRQKLIALRALLSGGLGAARRAVWWLDADALIVNASIGIDNLLRVRAEDAIYTRDRGEVGVQAGSFLIRRSEWSLRFMEEIYQEWTRLPSSEWYSDRFAVTHWLRRSRNTTKGGNSHVAVLGSRSIDSMRFSAQDLVYHQAGGDLADHLKYQPGSDLSKLCRKLRKEGEWPRVHDIEGVESQSRDRQQGTLFRRQYKHEFR